MKRRIEWKALGIVVGLGVVFSGTGCGGPDVFCGNGVIDGLDECDDGNTLSGDGCSATCLSESPVLCGNSALDPGEQCDDGNILPGDGCDAMCQLEGGGVCGDGALDPGEQCDDGNTTPGDGCDASCQLEGGGVCGDGTVDPGEQCDDGNTTPGDGCDAMCQLEGGGVCGDGVLDAGEQCDDGNTTAGDGCDDLCQLEGVVACGADLGGVSCGSMVTGDTAIDGLAVTGTYACLGFAEDGPELTYVFVTAVSQMVQIDLTGLGADLDLLVIEDAGAGCDPAACTPAMSSIAGMLMDEQVVFMATAGSIYYIVVESYDVGGGAYTLDVTCLAPGVCGDGVLDAGEQCDDGNTTPGDGCDDLCQLEGSACPMTTVVNCGDVIMADNTTGTSLVSQWGCFGWPNNGPELGYELTTAATVPVDLTLTMTNPDLDLIVIADGGMGCDPTGCEGSSGAGGAAAEMVNFVATAGTTYYIFVDGYIEGGEPGGPFTLDITCGTPAVCGDGTVDPGEQCDDGNTTPGDGCDAMCQWEPAVCGNGVLEMGEQCDDGNTTPGDGCDAACQFEATLCGPDLGLIACGGMTSDDTTLSGIAVEMVYACFGWTVDGPELTYVFTPTTSEMVQVDMTGLTADLDLIIIEEMGAGCDPTSCLPAMISGAAGTADEQVVFMANAGATYYIVVESFDVAGGAFDLFIGCPSTTVCGNGVVEPGEQCDDGNTTPGDGCDAACQFEAAVCGNGAVEPGEQCDDGNTTSGDGCDLCVWECGPLPMPVVDCTTPITDDTATNGVAVEDTYSCGGFPEAGPEMVYLFTSPLTGTVTFDLTGLGADLDLFGVGDTPASCTDCVVASEAGGTADESIVLPVTAGLTYQIIVESYDVSGGAFTLTATCGNPSACVGDQTAALSGGTPFMTTADNSTGTDDTSISCIPPPGPTGCPGGGEDEIIEIDFPAGFTDLEVIFDHGAGDNLYAVFGDPACSELDCYDPFPATMGTNVFAGVSTGAAPVTLYLVVEACGPATGASTSLTLTALP